MRGWTQLKIPTQVSITCVICGAEVDQCEHTLVDGKRVHGARILVAGFLEGRIEAESPLFEILQASVEPYPVPRSHILEVNYKTQVK